MKNKLTVAFSFLFLLMGNIIFAQKIKLIEGKLSTLKSENEMNIEYEYSPMKVGKFDKEEDYLMKKKEDFNKSEEGKGDKWEEAWKQDRTKRFEPQFEELFNKYGRIKVKHNASLKYTLILKTNFTEPGFNIGIVRQHAIINAEAWIVETSNHSNVLAKISINRSPGRTFGGYDFDTGLRIQEAYAAAGKALGKYMKK